jgi:putative ABC transport system permease protein
MRHLLHELRLAARGLLRAPGFSVSALLVLTLAIGSLATVFGVVDAVLLRALPYRDPARLVVVWEKHQKSGHMKGPAAPGNMLSWRDESRSFTGLEGIGPGRKATLGGPEPERIDVGYVTAGLLPLLGVRPELGRQLVPEENLPRHSRAALLSHELWQRRFGGDPGVVGRSIEIEGVTREVAGVLPPGFRFFGPVDALLPAPIDPADRAITGRWLVVIGRLAQGVPLGAAQAEMEGISARLEKRDPKFRAGWSVNLVLLKEQLVGELRPAIVALFVAVFVVFLIACANVAGLVVTRAIARRHELGVRVALGASGARLVAQLMAEGLVVSLCSGGAGLLLARALLSSANRVAARFAPTLPLDARLSPSVLVFAAAATLAAALVTAVVAVTAASEREVVTLLKRGTAAPKQARARGALVVLETALSVVLLVGAGLLVRTVRSVLGVDAGFAPERVLTLSFTLPERRYPTDEKVTAFTTELLARVQTIPGVKAAGTISSLPLEGLAASTGYTVIGRPAPPPDEMKAADVRAVQGDYFGAMGIPILEGSGFPASPVAKEAPLPVVINKTLARREFPNGGAVGSLMHIEWEVDVYRIVGIVGDVRVTSLDKEPQPTAYWDARGQQLAAVSLVVKTAADPGPIGRAVAAQVRALDPGLPVSRVKSMLEVVGDAASARRALALLVAGFAGVALLLTAVGLYGVVSYLVAQRTSEIGVRMALGAEPRDIVTLVVRSGALLAGGGIAAGMAGALALAPLAQRLLYGIGPHDVVTFVAVPALLGAIALFACVLPAWRAARVDPVVALRTE